MDTFDSNQLYSSACAPCYSDDSIFFNLILNSDYENTKENCLTFLNNYSKQILLTKRDIFKIFISELTVGEYSNQNIICNDESKYLIRQVVKKYSKNNILNALYEFISENDNSSIDQDKNNSCNTNNSSTKKSRKNESEEKKEKEENEEKRQKPKRNIKRFNGIRKKPQLKKEKCVTESKEKEKENNSSSKKILNLLTKKRKLSDSPRKEKKEKKPKIDKKEKEEKSGKNDKSKKLKKLKKDSDEEDKSEEDEEKDSQKDENENEEKNSEEIKDKTDENKGKENQEDNLEENSIEKEEKDNKNKEKKKENSYKNKLRNLTSPKNKSVKSFITKSVNKPKTNPKRHTLGDEIIKLESSEEQNINNSMTLSPLKAKDSNDKKFVHQLDILSYLKLSKSQVINSTTKKYNDNEFRSHLIKDIEKNFVFSFKLKKFQNSKNKIILFECNNRKCKGRGEYDVNKKIFKETVAHSLSLNSHKLSSFHYSVKETLLNDCDCFGYQLLKDNSFIKDKKVIMIN